MHTPAVLLLVFNRPELTRRVMAAIRAARPLRLYVAADGPRASCEGEAERCSAARGVATEVDWSCAVKTLFRESNLGCRVGVSTALDWFFAHEEEGIILEDDCIPAQSFFPYCAELLGHYRHDKRIMCISGDNFQRGRSVTPYSYYFSRYMQCWGWATWRRAWVLYDRDMKHWPEFKTSGGLAAWSDGDAGFEAYWTRKFDMAARGDVDSWAYRFLFTCWLQAGLTCIPERNLVSNIGFGASFTHTGDAGNWRSHMPAHALDFPLRHPPFIVRNADADRYDQAHCFADKAGRPQSLLGRGLRLMIPGSVRARLRTMYTVAAARLHPFA